MCISAARDSRYSYSFEVDPQKTPSLKNSSIVGRCHGKVFDEQLPSSGHFL
jgi:hypothetical protein